MLSLGHHVAYDPTTQKTQERAIMLLLEQVLPLVNPFRISHPIRRKETAIYSLVVYILFIQTFGDERDGLIIYK